MSRASLLCISTVIVGHGHTEYGPRKPQNRMQRPQKISDPIADGVGSSSLHKLLKVCG